MRRSILFSVAPAAVAVVIAGCGGGAGGAGGYGGYRKATATKSASAGATVSLAHSKFGNVLVDGHGRTLYLFAADKTMASTCYGSCASLWPPLTVSGTAKAAPQIRASLLGTTKRTDGTSEVTYAGHPLYYYAPDTQPGDFTGQNLNQFGAPWYVLNGNGIAVTGG
jgi:predicted lipoprotein with Yx(FWY)xxD motif